MPESCTYVLLILLFVCIASLKSIALNYNLKLLQWVDYTSWSILIIYFTSLHILSSYKETILKIDPLVEVCQNLSRPNSEHELMVWFDFDFTLSLILIRGKVKISMDAATEPNVFSRSASKQMYSYIFSARPSHNQINCA